MSLYKIKICSFGSGWKDERNAVGSVEEGEFLKISYSLDGDECVFVYSGGSAVQERRGSQRIKIGFDKGRATQCVIGSGSLSGAFDIYTRDIIFKKGKFGFRIILDYESGSDREKIKLELTAVKAMRGDL